MKTKYPRTRKAYDIPNHIPDKQIDRYLGLTAGGKFKHPDTYRHLKSLDEIGCIS